MERHAKFILFGLFVLSSVWNPNFCNVLVLFEDFLVLVNTLSLISLSCYAYLPAFFEI